MKRISYFLIIFWLSVSLSFAQGGPVGGNPSGPIYTPPSSGGADLPAATEAEDGKPLVWDFAGNTEAWSDLDPDHLAGDTTDDDAIDTAVLSADAQASLGLADSAVQPGDTVSFDGITDTSTEATNIAVGTTGSRPVGIAGDLRLNSTLGALEAYDGAAWDTLIWSGDLAAIATTGVLSDGTGTIGLSAIDGLDASTAAGQIPVGDGSGGLEVAVGLTWLSDLLTVGNALSEVEVIE